MPDPAANLDEILPPGSPRQIEHARLGSAKSKLIVRIGDSREVLLFFRLRRVAERFAGLLRLLERHGVIAQKVERSGPAPGRGGWHFVATTWLEGRLLDAKDHPQDLADLGRALARLHAITSPKWGYAARALPLRRPGYRFKVLIDAMRGAFTLWRAHPALGARLIAVLRWLWPQTARLGDVREFHLLHGDVHRRNVLIGARGLGFLDYDEMMFDHRGFEVAACLYRPCGSTGWARFWAAYRAGIGGEAAAELDRAGALWLAAATLRWARIRLRRTPDRADRLRKAQVYADNLARLRAAFPAGGGTLDAAVAAVMYPARG